MSEEKKNGWRNFSILSLSLLMVVFLSAGSFFGYSIYQDRKEASVVSEKLDKINKSNKDNASASEEKIIQEENDISRFKNIIKERDKTLKPAVKKFLKTVEGLNKNVSTDKEMKRFKEMKSDIGSGIASVEDIKGFAKELDKFSKDLLTKQDEYIEEGKRSKLEDEIKRQQEEQRKREAEENRNVDNGYDSGGSNSDNNNNDSGEKPDKNKDDNKKDDDKDNSDKPDKDKDAWLKDLKIILNSVDGSKYKLVEFDGQCNGKKMDSCSTANGTIKVTKKVADYSHSKKVSLMAYEVSQQRLFAVWDTVKNSEEFDELFNKDRNKLAECMAVQKGAKDSGKCTADQLEYAKSLW